MAIFIRRLSDAGLSPIAVAFFRYAITAIVLAPCLALSSGKRRATAWGLLSGLISGLGWIAYVETINTGDVATAGVAYMTYPIFTVAACWLVFRVVPSLRSAAAGLLVVVAAALALGSDIAAGLSPIVFVAPISFGFGIAVLTERLHTLDPFERLAAIAVGASFGLSPLVVTMPIDEVVPSDLSGFVWIVVIGVGCALVPMTIYGAAAPSIGAAKTAVAGAAELPTMFLIGALLFGEHITIAHLVAGLIIVGAISLTPSTRTIHVVPDHDTNPNPASHASSHPEIPDPTMTAAPNDTVATPTTPLQHQRPKQHCLAEDVTYPGSAPSLVDLTRRRGTRQVGCQSSPDTYLRCTCGAGESRERRVSDTVASDATGPYIDRCEWIADRSDGQVAPSASAKIICASVRTGS